MKNPANYDFIDLPPKKNAPMYFFLVRIMDLVISITALILLFPIMFVTALAIILEDGHNPFYFSDRLGKNRKPFKFYKFRSMKVNAWELERKDKKIMKQLRSGKHKVENHPHVTRVGKFIRKYSIDEFPQFLNILKGDMSFVGPRAQYTDEVEKFNRDFPNHKKYVEAFYEVKPGLTGYWQVSGRNKIDFDKRMRMEAYYARNYSILNDIIIVIKTPFAVLKAETH